MVDYSNISVTCTVHLGTDKLSPAEYEELRIGDIILLSQEATKPIDLKVEGKSFCKVKPGLEGMYKAAVVSDE